MWWQLLVDQNNACIQLCQSVGDLDVFPSSESMLTDITKVSNHQRPWDSQTCFKYRPWPEPTAAGFTSPGEVAPEEESRYSYLLDSEVGLGKITQNWCSVLNKRIFASFSPSRKSGEDVQENRKGRERGWYPPFHVPSVEPQRKKGPLCTPTQGDQSLGLALGKS